MARQYRLNATRKGFNQFLKALINLGIPTGNTCLLIVSGRKSGRVRATPVTVLEQGGRRWLVAPYGEVGWVHNVRAVGEAVLKSRGRHETIRLRPASTVEAAPVLKAYVENYRIVAPYFDAKPGDSVERFAAEAGQHPVFGIGRG